jgi:hypothetical protein
MGYLRDGTSENLGFTGLRVRPGDGNGVQIGISYNLGWQRFHELTVVVNRHVHIYQSTKIVLNHPRRAWGRLLKHENF